ncbi:MAG: aminotransferase class V-fold PLP-dependent enzyme [Candidatus Omnitrophica bacterium]|nr:aminotransferase class V-fold PLP-dependent enzyme [Candidatus Omnitrophota bacterium]
MSEIFLDAPNLGDLEKRYLCEAIDSGYVSTVGPFIPQFEQRFAEWMGSPWAVATQSGTASLHMALYQLGIGPGDEVIVPALTFVASINPILYVGATPVLADIDLMTWNIDPKKMEQVITPKTKAVIPVHLFGNPCAMKEILEIAQRHKLFVIEDATESLGASFDGRMTGTLGDLGCFSFNGNKIMTTGGGGMILGKDKDSISHIRFLVNQGRDESRGYFHPEMGFNYRMTNLEAALGLAQMDRLKEFLQKKKRYHEIYQDELSGFKNIIFQREVPKAQSTWWLNSVLIPDHKDLASVQNQLKEQGIPTRRFFMPVTEFPMFSENGRSGFPNTYQVFEKGLCLPSSTLNQEEDVVNIARQLIKILDRRN